MTLTLACKHYFNVKTLLTSVGSRLRMEHGGQMKLFGSNPSSDAKMQGICFPFLATQ